MHEFVIVGAKVFDGEKNLGQVDVHVADGVIVSVGGPRVTGVEVVDVTGATLLPGLIDAHTHTDAAMLRQALTFGVTTELDMGSVPATMIPLRAEVEADRTFADVRSASFSLTHLDGHPHQFRKGLNDPVWPTATTVAEAAGFVEDRISEGADYIKLIAESGEAFGFQMPHVPLEIHTAVIAEAHARGKMVMAHAMTLHETEQMVDAGADGLAHLFADTAHTPEIVDRIASANVFVVPTLTPLASIVGLSHSTDLAQDPRVAGKLAPELRAHLSDTFGGLPTSHFDMALATIAALREAGVDVIAGTDAAALAVRGVTHGASLHGELQLLVQAGFSPTEALRSATSLTARRFGLHDRGRVEQGLRADLVLVDGDPTTTINDSLSIRAVWRQGTRLAAASTHGSR
jgi:imidazolonepropionase-like amidohydrolase